MFFCTRMDGHGFTVRMNNPMVQMKKIRLIRAIRVQKNKWSGGKE